MKAQSAQSTTYPQSHTNHCTLLRNARTAYIAANGSLPARWRVCKKLPASGIRAGLQAVPAEDSR
jgi:hypothetical protein